LVWSYVLERECSKIKDDNKRNNVLAWKTFTINNVTETQDITRRALEIQKTGVKEKDALHVACAIAAGCHFFVTTDHRLLKYRSKDIYICDPTECMEFL
jgi:predicted nucleic acid-binding protein